jgi:hypothetical protein
MSREEAGRRGAEARWGRSFEEDDDDRNYRSRGRSRYENEGDED